MYYLRLERIYCNVPILNLITNNNLQLGPTSVMKSQKYRKYKVI